jgi:dual specificity phosphatase 12
MEIDKESCHVAHRIYWKTCLEYLIGSITLMGIILFVYQRLQQRIKKKKLLETRKDERLLLSDSSSLSWITKKTTSLLSVSVQPLQISPHLFLGCRNTIVYLDKYKITSILNISRTPDSKFLSLPTSIRYKQISIADSPQARIGQYFASSNAFIESAISKNQNVLVHCAHGISRSATLVIAYLMWKRRISRDAATDIVRQSAPRINPNVGFIQQLMNYQLLLGITAVADTITRRIT